MMRELFDGAGHIDPDRSWTSVQTRIAAPSGPRLPRKGVVMALAALAIAGATAAVVANAPIKDRTAAECRSYSSDGTSLDGTEVAVAVAGDRPTEIGLVTEPIEQCAQLWRDGFLVKDHEGVSTGNVEPGGFPDRQFPVPPLVLCADPSSEMAVVVVGSTDEACRDAGVVPAREAG